MFRWVQKCKGYNHEILLVRNNRVIRMYPEKLALVMRGEEGEQGRGRNFLLYDFAYL